MSTHPRADVPPLPRAKADLLDPPAGDAGAADASSSQSELIDGGALSLSGLLIAAIGAILLFVWGKFADLLLGAEGPGRMLLFAIAMSLLLWGVKLCLTGSRPDTARRPTLRLTRYRVVLPRHGVVYLVIMATLFVGSLLGRSNMLMLVFAMMAGPFVINGWITFSMLRRTQVTRLAPERVMAGEPVSVEVALENHKLVLSSWLMTVHDQVRNDRERLEPSVLFARVPARDWRQTLYQMRLMQRGLYVLGPMHVKTRFPLGLVERGLLFETFAEIIVHPRLGRLSSAWRRQFLMASELVHRRELRRGVFDDEFHSIREYRWGDNPRAIHWRTSARRNEIMIREFHQSRDQNLVVLLDLWLPPRPSAADAERVELAVSFAATVCVAQMRQSRDSSLCVAASGSGFTRWEGQSGPASMESLMDMLALLRPGASDDVSPLIDEAQRQSTSNARTLLVTTRRDPDRLGGEIGRFAEGTNGVQVIEADRGRLASIFEID